MTSTLQCAWLDSHPLHLWMAESGPPPSWEWKLLSCVQLFVTPWTSWNYSGQKTRVGSHSLLQGTFPTQELNPGLLHYRWILCQLSYQGSPSWRSTSLPFLLLLYLILLFSGRMTNPSEVIQACLTIKQFQYIFNCRTDCDTHNEPHPSIIFFIRSPHLPSPTFIHHHL